MAKIITAASDVKTEIPIPSRGFVEINETFYGFLLTVLRLKCQIADMDQLCQAIEIKRKLKAAEDSKALTVTLEDAEYKALSLAIKAYLPTMIPGLAMACVDFFKAMEEKNVQTENK